MARQCPRMPMLISASCSSLTERILTRSPPRARAGARARPRASMSPIGGRTRRDAGSDWDEPCVERLAADALLAPLPSLQKSVGISPPPAAGAEGKNAHVPARRLRRVDDHGGFRCLSYWARD